MTRAFAYGAAAVLAAWGVSHLLPTRRVVAGFGAISADNRRIITMEWVAEGLSFLFVAALVAAATIRGEATGVVYLAAAGYLAVIGTWTALTGARTGVIWFRLCPVVMGVTAGLLVSAALL